MARIIRRREAARRDLVDLFVWYGEHAGVDVAERFLAAAQNALEQLAAFPECGTPVEVDGIDLVRVIHGSRDLNRLFEEGFLS